MHNNVPSILKRTTRGKIDDGVGLGDVLGTFAAMEKWSNGCDTCSSDPLRSLRRRWFQGSQSKQQHIPAFPNVTRLPFLWQLWIKYSLFSQLFLSAVWCAALLLSGRQSGGLADAIFAVSDSMRTRLTDASVTRRRLSSALQETVECKYTCLSVDFPGSPIFHLKVRWILWKFWGSFIQVEGSMSLVLLGHIWHSK